MTKALLESGVAYVAGYQGAPISHLMDVLADAQDILVEHGIRFENSASEATAAATLAGLGELPAARRRHVQSPSRRQRRFRCARQPRFRRRDRRRARHRRRGLRRGLDHHAGAQPRLRDEVADLAARPAAEPAVDRQRGEGRLRAVRGQPHAGDAAAAHPRLPRARPLRRRAQPARRRSRCRRRSTAPLRDTARIALPPATFVHEQEKIERALAGGGALHRGARAERVLRAATARDDLGIIVQGGHYNSSCARSSGSAWPTSTAARRCRSTYERRLPA